MTIKKIASILTLATSIITYTTPSTTTATITIPVPEGSYLYNDYIACSVDHPDITLSHVQASTQPIAQYDPTFNETKKVYTSDVTFTVQATTENPDVKDGNVLLAYYGTHTNGIQELMVPLNFAKTQANTVATAVDVASSETATTTREKEPNTTTPKPKTIANYVSALVESTESLSLRIILVLLLGILMSLTPCIYPMIPITVGILQSRGSTSLVSNFLISLAYTLGIATTFAFLGLLAAFTGQLFGSCMTNPLVIGILVALLMYLAGSMFGLYEMYIPKSLRVAGPQTKGGSYISAFAFGLVSGLVASPCLSPGLILLLSIVTTLGSTVLGFILLFAFGVGLSLPLLLVGTFSSSLNILPRAGMWMIEVKHLFGFMLLGMCFYFVKPLVPWSILGWFVTVFILCMAFFYLYTGSRAHSKYLRITKVIAGILLIASAVVTAAYTLKTDMVCKGTIWRYEYEEVRAHARRDNKLLLLGFGAPFCSMCTAIDNDMFQDPGVCTVLNDLHCVKISADNDAPYVDELHKQYKILGFPTYVLINPHTGEELKRWGCELYEMPHCEFIAEIEKLRLINVGA